MLFLPSNASRKSTAETGIRYMVDPVHKLCEATTAVVPAKKMNHISGKLKHLHHTPI